MNRAQLHFLLFGAALCTITSATACGDYYPGLAGLEISATHCQDGADNDGDGLPDCSDPDCQGFTFCSEDDPGTDADTDADADTGTSSSSDSESDTETETETDSNSDTDSTADSDSGTDTEKIVDCLEGSFTISNSLDVATLAPYPCLTGDLTVDGAGLTALDLPNLTAVDGSVYITGLNALDNLDGLSALTTIGGSLWMAYNESLKDVSGLSALTTVGGDLTVVHNNLLPDLTGLENLVSVGADIDISANLWLANLDGLSSLESMGLILDVQTNYSLPDCEVCALLDQFEALPGWIFVQENESDSCTPVPESCP